MGFRWEPDVRAEAEGVVSAVDVTRHAVLAGLAGATLVSRGFWVRAVGAGPNQQDRLVRALEASARDLASPDKASEDGNALLFRLRRPGAQADLELVCVGSPERDTRVFMLRSEFDGPPAGRSLRIRVVAEDATYARA